MSTFAESLLLELAYGFTFRSVAIALKLFKRADIKPDEELQKRLNAQWQPTRPKRTHLRPAEYTVSRRVQYGGKGRRNADELDTSNNWLRFLEGYLRNGVYHKPRNTVHACESVLVSRLDPNRPYYLRPRSPCGWKHTLLALPIDVQFTTHEPIRNECFN
jgi:hypothetical protein